MLIINDDDVCPECGAYYQGNGYCANGHARPVTYKQLYEALKVTAINAIVDIQMGNSGKAKERLGTVCQDLQSYEPLADE